jgi:large conductance mechanosensitive channel
VAQGASFDEFKKFLLRGNVVQLAVAIIIGVAFVAVVDSLVSNMITPLIAMIFGEHSLAALSFTINDAEFRYGAVLDDAITFVVIVAIVFYLVVLPANRLVARFNTEPSPEPTERQCPYCLGDVPKPASRCRYCTSELEPVAL